MSDEPNPTEEFLSVKQFARLVGMHHMTVYQWLKRGLIVGATRAKVGKREWHISVEANRQFIEQRIKQQMLRPSSGRWPRPD